LTAKNLWLATAFPASLMTPMKKIKKKTHSRCEIKVNFLISIRLSSVFLSR